MTKENSVDYITLTTTISELNKIGQTTLADRLLDILANNELVKPDKHNAKQDKTTSFYSVALTEDELETIIDLFHDLEVKYLGKDYETSGASSSYASIADHWTKIKSTI